MYPDPPENSRPSYAQPDGHQFLVAIGQKNYWVENPREDALRSLILNTDPQGILFGVIKANYELETHKPTQKQINSVKTLVTKGKLILDEFDSLVEPGWWYYKRVFDRSWEEHPLYIGSLLYDARRQICVSGERLWNIMKTYQGPLNKMPGWNKWHGGIEITYDEIRDCFADGLTGLSQYIETYEYEQDVLKWQGTMKAVCKDWKTQTGKHPPMDGFIEEATYC